MRRGVHAVVIIAGVLALVFSFSAVDVAAEMSYEIGFKGGYNIAKIIGADVEPYAGLEDPGIEATGNVDDFKPGFVGGVFFRFQFTKMLGLQLETIYNQKGSKGNIEGLLEVPPYGAFTFDFEANLTFFYFEFPLLAVISYPVLDFLTVSAMGGPVIGYCSKAEAKFEGLMGIEGVEGRWEGGERRDIGDYTKDFDFGVVLAGGLAVDIGRVNILLESRWTRGISSIDDSGSNYDVKNNAFSFMIGMGVPIGGTD